MRLYAGLAKTKLGACQAKQARWQQQTLALHLGYTGKMYFPNIGGICFVFCLPKAKNSFEGDPEPQNPRTVPEPGTLAGSRSYLGPQAFSREKRLYRNLLFVLRNLFLGDLHFGLLVFPMPSSSAEARAATHKRHKGASSWELKTASPWKMSHSMP